MSQASRAALLFREVRVRFDLKNLQRMTARVTGDQQQPLVTVKRPDGRNRMIEEMIPQVFLRRLDEIDRLRAAIQEELDGIFRSHGILPRVDRLGSCGL